MNRIHLDYASSAPLLPEVKVAMTATLDEVGNPSSIHQSGRRAKQLLEQARRQVAALINAEPDEIHFTSCGTESNNWAIRGLLAANKRKGKHLIISTIEHPSISLVARRLETDGAARVTVLPVDGEAMISPQALREAMTPETALVSLMLANGEVGTIEPVAELAAIAHEHGVLFHTDAIAAAGHAPVDVQALGADALSLAANQFYGPQGAAALFVREGLRILPLLEGGGQESGGRSGTEALPAIIGMGAAAGLAARRLGTGGGEQGPCAPAADDAGSVRRGEDARGAPRQDPSPSMTERLNELRDRLRDGLVARIERMRLNGSWVSRLPHNLHVCIEGAASEALVLALDEAGIAAGLGSACNAKAMRPSHVLKAMGLSDEQAAGALVFTLGAQTIDEEIGQALDRIPPVIGRLRRLTSLTARA